MCGRRGGRSRGRCGRLRCRACPCRLGKSTGGRNRCRRRGLCRRGGHGRSRARHSPGRRSRCCSRLGGCRSRPAARARRKRRRGLGGGHWYRAATTAAGSSGAGRCRLRGSRGSGRPARRLCRRCSPGLHYLQGKGQDSAQCRPGWNLRPPASAGKLYASEAAGRRCP